MYMLKNKYKYMIDEKIEEEFYITRDIKLAAILLTLKFSLEGYDIQYEGRKVKPIFYFKFKNNERIQEASIKALNRQINVEPYMFTSHMNALKSIMKNETERNHEI